MECAKCNGTGYVNKEDYTHDVIIRERCIDCMLVEKKSKNCFQGWKCFWPPSAHRCLLGMSLSQSFTPPIKSIVRMRWKNKFNRRINSGF